MFKPGDLVIMNDTGFAYHGNLDRTFESYSVGLEIRPKAFEAAICEIMAIQGVGEVLYVKEDAIRVKFKYSVKGLYYFYTSYYNPEDVSKLTLLQKLKYKLLGRV